MTADPLLLIIPLEKKWSGEARAQAHASKREAAGRKMTPAEITKESAAWAATEKPPTEKAKATETAIEQGRQRRRTAAAAREATDPGAAQDTANGERLAANMAAVRAVTHQQEKAPRGSTKREAILPSNVQGRRQEAKRS